MTARRRTPWYYWQIASVVAFSVAALGAIGEQRGWFVRIDAWLASWFSP